MYLAFFLPNDKIYGIIYKSILRGKIVPKTNDNKRVKYIIVSGLIVALCAVMLLLECLSINYVSDTLRNEWISRIVSQICGIFAVILLLLTMNVRLFDKPKKMLYILPALLVAIDNFQFYAYFSGKMQLVRTEALDFVIFFVYCLVVGLFEECVFRGVLFSLLAGIFPNNKWGLVKTFLFSSLLFGVSHLFNLLVGAGFGATVLQVGYSILTGGLFAFVLIKTKNLFCCAIVHALYNFCGMLMEAPANLGLGSGVVFDLGTGITMAIVGVIVGVFVLYSLRKYPENERVELYTRLGIANNP